MYETDILVWVGLKHNRYRNHLKATEDHYILLTSIIISKYMDCLLQECTAGASGVILFMLKFKPEHHKFLATCISLHFSTQQAITYCLSPIIVVF
jgi:hypothetical protein